MYGFEHAGKNPIDEYLDGMMNEAPGPINFTMFLTLFGERLQGTDPEDVIKNAFACFDEDNTGYINEERLRELLVSMGDRFTDEDVSTRHGSTPTYLQNTNNECKFINFRLMKCFGKLLLKMECLIMLNLLVF